MLYDLLKNIISPGSEFRQEEGREGEGGGGRGGGRLMSVATHSSLQLALRVKLLATTFTLHRLLQANYLYFITSLR